MSSVHWTLYRVMQQVQVHETEIGELRFMCRMLFLCKVKKNVSKQKEKAINFAGKFSANARTNGGNKNTIATNRLMFFFIGK